MMKQSNKDTVYIKGDDPPQIKNTSNFMRLSIAHTQYIKYDDKIHQTHRIH